MSAAHLERTTAYGQVDERACTRVFSTSGERGEGRHRRPRLVAVDLFAGAGGLSFAFHRAGFRIAACVENDPNAAETYRRSFVNRYSRSTQVIEADIRSPGVIEKLRIAAGGGVLDILIGGPPCQDFSPACLRRLRREDRMALVADYLRILEALRPRAFLFENVPGLLESDDGTHWETIQHRVDVLGYTLLHNVLRAEDYGVPQRRHRLFVVGMMEPCAGRFRWPRPTGKRVTVREAIGHLKALGAGRADRDDPDHRARAHTPQIVEYIKAIPPGGHWRDAKHVRVLDAHTKDGKLHNGHYDVYGRMMYDEISPTMTGGCTNPSRGRFIHPTANRGLTVREAALLQTFPADWHFYGGIEACSQQVGNAVPVRLGRALARTVSRALLFSGGASRWSAG